MLSKASGPNSSPASVLYNVSLFKRAMAIG